MIYNLTKNDAKIILKKVDYLYLREFTVPHHTDEQNQARYTELLDHASALRALLQATYSSTVKELIYYFSIKIESNLSYLLEINAVYYVFPPPEKMQTRKQKKETNYANYLNINSLEDYEDYE